jgi:hypothetical protein
MRPDIIVMAENATTETETLPDDEGRPLEVYEWGGSIVALLGFLFTPVVTGLPATYCALKIRSEKPLAAVGIGIALAVTTLFWASFVFGEQAIALAADATLVVVGVGGLVLFAVVFAAIYYLVTVIGQDESTTEQ